MALRKKKRRERSFSERMKIYDAYYKRTGLYKFLIQNFLKLTLVLAGIAVLLILTNKILLFYGIEVGSSIQNLINNSSSWFVLLIFYISESVLGWIPPDIFIAWAKYKPTVYPYLNITIIASLSYLGGITAYILGEYARRFPKVNNYIERKYAQNFALIKKWGGIVIVMAALFPLPFATISTVAGIVNYPFRLFLMFGLTRYIRFYLYAIPIMWAVNNLG